MTDRRSTLEHARFGPPPAISLGGAAAQEHCAGVATAPRAISTMQLSVDETTPEPGPALQSASHSTGTFKRGSMRKRFLAALALIAVPAIAAPGDFGAMAGDAPGAESAMLEPDIGAASLAFEQPGMSFPGSAFYYLADPPSNALVALPETDPLTRGAQGGRDFGDLIDAGPAARPFVSVGSGAARAQQCLAQAIWYEAASESEAGQRAVAQVVLNRVAHPSWPGSVCGVVFEGSDRKSGCQFSFTCDGSLARKAKGATWARARRIAGEALSGQVYAPIGHATHYHTLWVDPYWAKSLSHVGTIGAHRFYRNRGKAGEKAAFTAAYSGREPDPAVQLDLLPERAPQLAASPEIDTFASSAGEATTSVQTISAIAQSEVAPKHAGVGSPRKAFAKSGQWKVDPATLDLLTEAKDAKPEPEPEPSVVPLDDD
jgi:hypothetical protein